MSTKAHRFCRDCGHCVTRRTMFGLLSEDRCGAPQVAHPVTAQPVYACDQMRAQHAPCGPKARLYLERTQPTPPVQLVTKARLVELFGQHIARARA